MKATLVYPITEGKILLAQKMKKVGAGKWNGFGGKPEPHDISLRHTASRELFEETGFGIETRPESLVARAVIDFFFFENTTEEADFSVAIYTAPSFTGKATSTIEMSSPTFFALEDIPYDEMLPADREFLPRVLSGASFVGKVRFNEGMSGVLSSEYRGAVLDI